jgi:heptosyltransferase-2
MKKQTILIRSPNWVGDAVVSTSILKPLREVFLNDRIFVVAREYVSSIFANNPFIDGTIAFNGFNDGMKKIKGDIGLILPNSFSSALLFAASRVKRRIGYSCELRSFLLSDVLPPVALRSEHLLENYRRIALRIINNGIPDEFHPGLFLSESERVNDIFAEWHNSVQDKPVIIDPGSSYGKAKVWQVEKYAALIDYLMEQRKQLVIVLGSLKSIALVHDIVSLTRQKPVVLTGKFSLRESMCAIARCKLFISPDTGGMHIAAAFGVSQIAIFGSSSPVWTRPLNSRSRVICKSLSCSPCFKRECPLGTYKCLRSITVEDTIEKVEELL